MRPTARGHLVMWALPLLLIGCAHLPGRGRVVGDCPGQLVSSDELAGERLLRERVRIEAGGRTFLLRMITQQTGGELLVIGIDPLGAKLFTLRQVGRRVEVEALPAPVLEIEPVTLLRELHRMRYLTVPPGASGGPAVVTRRGTEIRERWEGGVLQERRFRRLDGDPAGTVTIRFETPGPAEEGIQRIRIDNPWCRYRAEILTLVDDSEL